MVNLPADDRLEAVRALVRGSSTLPVRLRLVAEDATVLVDGVVEMRRRGRFFEVRTALPVCGSGRVQHIHVAVDGVMVASSEHPHLDCGMEFERGIELQAGDVWTAEFSFRVKP